MSHLAHCPQRWRPAHNLSTDDRRTSKRGRLLATFWMPKYPWHALMKTSIASFHSTRKIVWGKMRENKPDFLGYLCFYITFEVDMYIFSGTGRQRRRLVVTNTFTSLAWTGRFTWKAPRTSPRPGVPFRGWWTTVRSSSVRWPHWEETLTRDGPGCRLVSAKTSVQHPSESAISTRKKTKQSVLLFGRNNQCFLKCQ